MTSASQRAYEAVRSSIVTGTLSAGDKIVEAELAEEVGVSRTPVREALRRLAAEGMIEFAPNRGARVSYWTPDDLREIYELRARVESYAAERAAINATSEQVLELEELAARMITAVDSRVDGFTDLVSDLNNRFHAKVVEAAGGERLRGTIGLVMDLTLVQRTFRSYTDEALARSMSQHAELVEAIRKGSPRWAGAVMQAHLLAAGETMSELALRPPPQPE